MARTLETRLAELRDEYQIAARVVEDAQARQLNEQWLEQFCANVKRKTGKWVYRGYRWHAWSFGYESALHGARAFDAFVERRATNFYMYFERDDLLLDCSGPPSPDLRSLFDDVYVFPHDLSWTFVLTHEMSMDLGPYFAARQDV